MREWITLHDMSTPPMWDGGQRKGDCGFKMCVSVQGCKCVCLCVWGRDGNSILTYKINHPALTWRVPGSPLLTQRVHMVSLLLRC